MSEQKDNQALEEYLDGKSGLSRHYHSRSTEEPPAHLDAAIISAAKQAVEHSKTTSFPLPARWYIPLSLAAVVVISFGVVFKIYDQAGQKTINRQTATQESEKPVMLMDDSMELDAGAPAAVMQDKIIPEEKIEMKNEAVGRSSSSFRKDVSPNTSVLSREKGPPATPAAGDVQIPAEKRMMESSESTFAADSSVATEKLAPEQWLAIINQLWFEGKTESADLELKNFIRAYPEYPVESLKAQLPEAMDLSVLTR